MSWVILSFPKAYHFYMSGLRDDIFGVFGAVNHVTLATVDECKPRLRPITVVRWQGGFYFATRTRSDKVSQIASNRNVEFILPLKEDEENGYVRVECVAEIVEDEETRNVLFNGFEFMGKLWKGPGDPSLTIFRLVPLVYDYMKPGKWNSIRVTA